MTAAATTPRTNYAPRFASWENEGGASRPEPRQETRLDWASFVARFYPDARRHDYAPLAAYEAYRKRWEA